MFGKLFAPVRRGHVVTAKTLNAPHRMLEQVSRLRGGQGTMWTPAGPFIAQPPIIFRLGQTSSGGIPAAQFIGLLGASFRLGTDNQVTDAYIELEDPETAILKASPTTFRAFNMSSHAVNPVTFIICALMWNLWVVIWEDCPP